jgi:hypothetical protein
LFSRQLDVDGQAVGVEARLLDQRGVGAGDGLEVDVAAEVVVQPQGADDADHVAHSVVRALDDAGGEEQALDVVAAVELEGEAHDLLGGEAGAAHIRRHAVHAVGAVEDAEVRHQILSSDTQRPSGVKLWQMPLPSVLPRPLPSRESRLVVPEEAQEAS